MSFSYFDGLITSTTSISKIYYNTNSNIVSGILDANNTITINSSTADFTINAMVIGGGGGGGGKGVFLSPGGYGFNTAGSGGGGGANVLISFPNNLLTNNIFEAVIGEGGICNSRGFGNAGGQTKLKLSTGSPIIVCNGGAGGLIRVPKWEAPLSGGGLPEGGAGGTVSFTLPGVTTINGGSGGKGGTGNNGWVIGDPTPTFPLDYYKGFSSQFGLDTSSNPISIPLIDISDNLNAQYGGCGGGGGGPWADAATATPYTVADGGLGGGQNITASDGTYYDFSYTAIGLKNGSYNGQSPQLGSAPSVVYGGGGGGYSGCGENEQLGADGMSGAVYFWLQSVTPPPPPPPPTPTPIPAPISNRPGPIQYCTSRFARCNITKKTSFSSGNVTIQGTTNARRQSLIVNQSTYRHGAKLLFSNQVLNAYGRKAGGPGGFGASPRNQF